MNPKQSIFDLLVCQVLSQAKRQPEIDIAHRKCDERLFVIDIELGVSYWNGGMRGKHDG